MVTGLTVWVVVAFILLLVAASAIIHYGFTLKKRAVEEAWSDLEKVLQHRCDNLVPHLMLLLKNRVGTENRILSEIMILRARAVGAESITGRGVYECSLTRELRRLSAFLKNYPDLLENWEVKKLMAALRDVEKRIGFSRRNYNNLVTVLNRRRETFPYRLIALLFGIKEGEYFQTEETAKELIAVGRETAPRRL